MEYLTVLFTSVAFLVFAFLYWRDSTAEGFSSEKILDSFFVILLGGLLGGKLLFRPISIDFFLYQFFNAPLILEGVLVGGGIAAYIEIKRNKWDVWKLGDMIAPAVAAFQSVIFLGIWVRTQTLSQLSIAISFIILYFFIRILRKGYSLGSTARYFQLRRLNKLTFTGALFAIYLTGSSLIAMLFLVTHYNLDSGFWWFQISFYLAIFASAWTLISIRLRRQGVKVSSFLPDSFVKRIRSMLSNRKDKLEEDVDKLAEKDPFIQEAKSDGFRNEDELGDEAAELQEHSNIQARKEELNEEIKEIDEALESIEEGQYGVCQNCMKKIDPKRLEVYPTAKYCIDCESKLVGD